ncbi:MAG: PAS domain S-box protein, partial [Thermoanaerobaculia bacterium]
MRISALVEFQLEISAQRRPHEILSILARASRNIVASEHSILTMFDGERIFGISNSKDNHVLLPDGPHAWSPHCREHLQLLVEEGKALRTTHPPECAQSLIGEIPVRSYIGVPVQTTKKSYGWLCLVNREDANKFSAEDERIVQTIAAQTAMAYENLLLYEEIRSEAELLDQNVNLLRTTIEASSDGIMVVDRASRIVTYNRRYAELWRVPLEILRAADARKCLEHTLGLVKDPRGFQDAVDRATHGEEVTRTYALRDGSYVECHVAPRTLKGEIIGRVWNFRDVTASVKTEEALRASEEEYRSLISNIPDVTWTADAHAKPRFLSANVVTLYGYSSEEIYLHPETFWLNRVHPQDVDRVVAHYNALFETGQPYDVEFRLQRKDGKWIWAHGWSVGTYERDVVVYADGVVRDITARKEAEAEFRRVAADRELLLESTADGIYAVDNKGRCTMANRVAAMLLGRTLDELIGKRVHDLMHHHKADGSRYPVEECAIYLAFKEGKASRIRDEVFWRKDGTSFPVEYVSSPLVDRGVVRGAVVTFADVTERQKLEQRLQQISRVSSLGRMAATIAHEFNNVLMGIQPFAETIRRRTAGDPKLQQAASQILNSVTRGKGVT